MITNKAELKFYMLADEIMNEQVFPHSWVKKILFPSPIQAFLKAMRHCEYYYNKKKRRIADRFLYILWKRRFLRYSYKTGFDIPINTIGYGCRIGHQTNIVISAATKIGNYCSLSNNITIADGNPKNIGSHVFIGSNVVIAKGVNIADGCKISACSFVNKSYDVPNRLVGGVPAVVIGECTPWTDYEPYKEEYDKCEKLRRSFFGDTTK